MHPVDALPTGTVTFLFTDIEGSTRLAERLGAGGRGGVVRGAPAGRAVGPPVAAQRALAAHAWPDGAAVRVRMGLHTGEGVLVSDGDYVGLDVHRAARVASAGHGGQVLVSSTTRALVDGALPAGVGLRDPGEPRPKAPSRPARG